MRVLWLTNQLMPEACHHLKLQPSVKGGWMSSLFSALDADDRIQLAGVSAVTGQKSKHFRINHSEHYILELNHVDDQFKRPDENIKRCFDQILEAFQPDIIHVHGTEKFYGLITKNLDIPVIVSIQGLLHVYMKQYYGGISIGTHVKYQTLSDWFHRSGVRHRAMNFQKRAEIEKEIIRSHHYFIGRSRWDRAHIRHLNPDAQYFHCHELMRPPFYSIRRNPEDIIPYTIFTPTSEYPLKGIHWLLEAASILKNDFPQLRIKIADAPFATGTEMMTWLDRQKQHGYRLYLARLVDKFGLKNMIQPTGQLDANQMAEMMAQSHVVVIPSMAENGCNTLHEAMLVGTPCAVSLVGGMISMIDLDQTALGFQAADSAMMAECIRQLFLDDTLAEKLTSNAREIVLKRHNKHQIVERMIQIYNTVATPISGYM